MERPEHGRASHIEADIHEEVSVHDQELLLEADKAQVDYCQAAVEVLQLQDQKVVGASLQVPLLVLGPLTNLSLLPHYSTQPALSSRAFLALVWYRSM